MKKAIEKYKAKLDYINTNLEKTKHLMGLDTIELMQDVKTIIEEVVSDLKNLKSKKEKSIKYGKVKIKTKGYPKEMLCSDNDMLYRQAIVIAEIKGNKYPYVAISDKGFVIRFKCVREPEKEPSVLGSISVPNVNIEDRINNAVKEFGEMRNSTEELKDRMEMIEAVRKYAHKHGEINTYLDYDYKMKIKKA